MQRPPHHDSAAFNGPITLAEVLWGSRHLQNGKVCGRAGWPDELLRHATYHVPSESGAPGEVWALAPLFTAMLDVLFKSGAVPAGVTSALVIPIRTKGNDLDPVNCRRL